MKRKSVDNCGVLQIPFVYDTPFVMLEPNLRTDISMGPRGFGKTLKCIKRKMMVFTNSRLMKNGLLV
jgi:hypothetical protein